MKGKITIESMLREAEISLDKRQYRKAARIYKKAIDICPGNSELWNQFGIAMEGAGQHEDAVAAYDRAISIQPSLAQLWNNKGNALDELARYEEALQAFDKALDIDPAF